MPVDAPTAFTSHAELWVAVATVWVALYGAALWTLAFGASRLPRSRRLPDAECMPVSVVVSARNEERDLPACINALLALDYPREKLQIVLVNDFSTDGTGALIDSTAAAHPHVIARHSATLPSNGLEAKARGIAHGINVATGEWVCITDADGTVAPSWVRHLLGRVDGRTGMCGGTLVVRDTTLLAITERMSWGFLQTFSSGLAGFRAPFVCLGPNMAIRRSAYTAAGGLAAVHDFTIAEDLALFRMATSQGLDVHMYADAETSVLLSPVPSFQHLLSQHRRWLGGGVEQSVWYRLALCVVLTWGFGVVMYALLGWLWSPGWWLFFWAAKLAGDAAALGSQQRRLQLARHLRYLPVLEVYQLVMVALLPLTFVASRRIVWKGDGYEVRYG